MAEGREGVGRSVGGDPGVGVMGRPHPAAAVGELAQVQNKQPTVERRRRRLVPLRPPTAADRRPQPAAPTTILGRGHGTRQRSSAVPASLVSGVGARPVVFIPCIGGGKATCAAVSFASFAFRCALKPIPFTTHSANYLDFEYVQRVHAD